jgi:hypothetical protein
MPSPLALAMLQQQPVTAPPQVSVAPTDVAQIYKTAQDAAMQGWKARLDQKNALWGNLAALGRAGINTFGGQLAGKLFPSAQGNPLDYSLRGSIVPKC